MSGGRTPITGVPTLVRSLAISSCAFEISVPSILSALHFVSWARGFFVY